MNYTHIFFAVLLLPVSGYGNAERIKQLKEEQFQKMLELKDLAKRISDADGYIHSCREFSNDLLALALQKKRQALGDSHYNEEDIKEGMERYNIALIDDLTNVFRGGQSFNYKLTQDLYDDPDTSLIDAFDSYRFMFIRAVTEQHLRDALIVRYELCLQELVNINKELKKLE